MNKIYYLFVSFVLIVLISGVYSCSKDESNLTLNEKRLTKFRNYPNSYQDDDFRSLAKVLSIGIKENEALRSLLKNEALLKFDGDFDILLSKIKNVKLITSNGQQTVSEFLGSIYLRLNISPTVRENEGQSGSGVFQFPIKVVTTNGYSTGTYQIANYFDIIPYLIHLYPEIQIAIPVHATDWNPVNYIPNCTYIPSNYNESTTLTVEGFNNGSGIIIDAVNEPTKPVLVVGLCERKQVVTSIETAPAVTIELTAATSSTGITLNWVVQNPNNDEITGYKIFRRSLNSSSFVQIYDNLDKDNKLYIDNHVNSLENYYYYVKAYNAMGLSESSNIASAIAPSVPSSAETFTANHYIQNEIELRWTYPQGQYIENSKLYKRVIGINSDYILVGTFPPSIHEFIDPDVTKGRRVNYKLELNNSQGNSNPKHDFIHVPFRDVANESIIILNEISYDSSKKKEIEGWMRGEPEFQMSIVKGSSSGDGVVVQANIGLFQCEGTTTVFNRNLLNWLPSDWSEILSFEVIENDYGPKIDLNIEAGFDKKDSTQTKFISGSAKITIPDVTDTDNEDCGKATTKFHDLQHPILSFPVGGVRVRLTN